MSRILLADDSPHAQRMGEFILREEGLEVVSVTDGQTALIRLADVDPDIVLVDVSLPTKNGYEICEAVKGDPRFCHTKVVLTAGAMEPIDEAEAKRVNVDGNLRKPFEATAMLEMVKKLVEAVRLSREAPVEAPLPVEDKTPEPIVEEAVQPASAEDHAQAVDDPALAAAEERTSMVPVIEPLSESLVAEDVLTEEPLVVTFELPVVPESVVENSIPFPKAPRWEIDPQAVRAAVTLALEAALPVLIDEVTQRVMTALAEQESRLEASEAASAGR